MDKRRQAAIRTISVLQSLVPLIRDGEPIEVTTVARFDTPDGPMHVREKTVINNGDEDSAKLH